MSDRRMKCKTCGARQEDDTCPWVGGKKVVDDEWCRMYFCRDSGIADRIAALEAQLAARPGIPRASVEELRDLFESRVGVPASCSEYELGQSVAWRIAAENVTALLATPAEPAATCAECERLRAALKPFADAWDYIGPAEIKKGKAELGIPNDDIELGEPPSFNHRQFEHAAKILKEAPDAK